MEEWMKAGKLLLLISGIVLFLNHVGGWSQEQYVAKADDVFYGTWANEHMLIQKSVSFLGGFKNYLRISDADPLYEGEQQIVERWTDSEGNIWFKTFGTVTKGVLKGSKFQQLLRLDKSGNVRENMWRPVSEFDPASYAPKIDPTDKLHYGLYYRTVDHSTSFQESAGGRDRPDVAFRQ
jgi:hypothetical protein